MKPKKKRLNTPNKTLNAEEMVMVTEKKNDAQGIVLERWPETSVPAYYLN
jgi:hypothetical protein